MSLSPRGSALRHCLFCCATTLALLTACAQTQPPESRTQFPSRSDTRPSVKDAYHGESRAASLARELADWTGRSQPSLVDDGPPVHTGGVAPQPLSRQPGKRKIGKRPLSVDAVKAPVESLLYALAADADVQLDLQSPLPGQVTLRVEATPLEHILAALAKQVPMRWQLDENRLRVSNTQPYTDSYPIDYLNIDRTTISTVGLATQVGTINAGGSSQSGGIANNSETLVENRADHRFWASLAGDLDRMLGGDNEPDNAGYSINRDAGLLLLTASVQTHAQVRRYLDALNARVGRQVLIEATVVEVTLSNRFEAGIDWRVLASDTEGFSGAQQLLGAPQSSADSIEGLASPGALLSLVQRGAAGTIAATLNLLEQFGDVRILSRPRIIALNNQSSVLKVVDNRVYFTVNVERQRGEDTDDIITETEIHTVPVGLVMNVTPFISAGDEVMLNVRPTLSRILGFVNDPNPALVEARVSNGVPEIQVREMESMLQVTSGDVAIIGGLMQDALEESEQRLPGLGRLPLIGSLFSSNRRDHRQTELLILLKPTVLAKPVRGSAAVAMGE